MECIFCKSGGPFSTIEHIIPESLGNDDLLLQGYVCDKCQSYFGKEIEKFVLEKTSFAFWRTYLGIKTKKSEWPSVDMSQDSMQKGVLPAIHLAHDNGVSFSFHDDLSMGITIDKPDLFNEIIRGQRTHFQFVITPKILHMLGRFLCKIGIELICLDDTESVYHSNLDQARNYARHGNFKGLWPLFHYSQGSPKDFRYITVEGSETLEHIDCYSYQIIEYSGKYLLFRLSMGTENWVICLNDPYPHPVIRGAFPDCDLTLIWYSNDELRR